MTDRPVVFDLTRLVTRLTHASPTGIDRVDLAYATTGHRAWTGTEHGWLGGTAPMWWSHADAATYRAWIEEAGLAVSEERTETGLGRRRGTVIEVQPPPGTPLAPGAEVVLVVSGGRG